MKLPNYEQAVAPQRKITEYLLSSTHRDGRGKAAFFIHFGFSADDWETFANALTQHAAEHEVSLIEESPFGTRYVIDGEVTVPDGRTPAIRVIWFIETGESAPRLVTAYPLKRRIQ